MTETLILIAVAIVAALAKSAHAAAAWYTIWRDSREG